MKKNYLALGAVLLVCGLCTATGNTMLNAVLTAVCMCGAAYAFHRVGAIEEQEQRNANAGYPKAA